MKVHGSGRRFSYLLCVVTLSGSSPGFVRLASMLSNMCACYVKFRIM
jgi:hypothetical protein